MPESPPSTLGKRPLPGNQLGSKRERLSHPSGESPPPPAFWDNLSTCWLTKRALRELDRRNAAPSPPYQPSHRPAARRARTELVKLREPIQSIADFLCHCGPRCLKDIKRFARHGGPGLLDLRGYPAPADLLNQITCSSQPGSQSQKQSQTSTSNTESTTNITQSTGPYDRALEQNLIDGGVYPEEYGYFDGQSPPQPDNWEDINERLTQSRASFSPSKFLDEDFRKFKRANTHAFKERHVITSVIPIVEGEIKDAECVSGGISFINLEHLTDGTLIPGKPDLYYGARPEQLDRRVYEELNNQIVPSLQDNLPIKPNFFLAAKGPGGSLEVAARQACYDGAFAHQTRPSLTSSFGQTDTKHVLAGSTSAQALLTRHRHRLHPSAAQAAHPHLTRAQS